MTKASDNLYPSILLEDHADPAAPTDGSHRLFVDTDEKLKMIDHASLVTVFGQGLADQGLATFLDFDGAAAPADPTGDHARIYAKSDGRIYSRDAGGTEYGPFDAAGTGGTVPPPDAIPASPHASDQEFNAALSGQTVLGTLDTNSVTNYPGLLEIGRTAGAWSVDGIYWATPAIPFTLTARLCAHDVDADYQHAGLMLLESSPGKLVTFGPMFETIFVVGSQSWTNRTTRAAAQSVSGAAAMYYRMVVASATSVVLQSGFPTVWGADGRWVEARAAFNPGFTPANWGVFVLDYYGATTKVAFDWVRFVTGTAGQTWNGTAWA